MAATSSDLGMLVWTLLPAGWVVGPDGSDVLRLSIMLSPRLIAGENATLANYPLFIDPDGTTNWADRAKTLAFVVQFDTGPTATVMPDVTTIDPTVWRALFPGTLGVTNHSFVDNFGRHFSTYATKENFQNIVDVYRQPPHERPDGSGPDIDALRRAATERAARLVPSTDEERQSVRAHVRRLEASHRAVTARHIAHASGVTADVVHFDTMASFYEGLSNGARTRYADAKANNFELQPHTFDFHTALTAVSRYPDLVRALGIVFDVDLPFTGPVIDVTDRGKIRISKVSSNVVNDPFEGWTSAGPWSRYVLDRRAKTFFVRSASDSSDLVSGMLSLPVPDDYTAMDLNLDELGHTLHPSIVQFHRDAARARATGAPAPTLTVPAPRSSGLSFARAGLAAQLNSMLQKQQTNNSNLEKDSSGQLVELGAEDLLRGFRVDIRIRGETTWRSLCQRAGTYTFTNGGFERQWTDEGFIALRAFNPDRDTPTALIWAHETLFQWQGWSLSVPRPGNTIGPNDIPIAQTDQGAANLPLVVTFASIDGTLPRLRFGWIYDCRLRMVDLAGNSLQRKDPISEEFTLSLGKYLRFDPLNAPTMLMRDVPRPGESMDRLVIRSYSNLVDTETTERLIAPPKTSVQMAEWHGMFDTPNGLDPTVQPLLVQFDGSFADSPYGDHPPSLPYLADPLARGATIDFAPNALLKPPNPLMNLPLTQVAYGGEWPKLETFRLVLADGDAEALWDTASRTLVVRLPKGWAVPITLASFMDDDVNNEGKQGLGLFDMWDSWKNDPIQRRNLELHRQAALHSKVPGLTPTRQLMLVHAVQRPLTKPELDPTAFVALRKPGDTFCRFGGLIPVDGPSTDKLELMAEWDELVDDGINPPVRRSSATLVRRRDIAAFETEWIPDIDQFQETANWIPTRHQFRDTKFRHVTYHVRATTRFREYFPPAITDVIDNISETSSKLAIDVPASARPAAPKVLYVVPTFGWETTGNGNEAPLARERHVGLRIYLDRPWYSSGDGELLGVVLGYKDVSPQDEAAGHRKPGHRHSPRRLAVEEVAAPDTVPETLAPFVTQWGTDPAFSGAAMPSAFTPLPVHFRNAHSVDLRVPLDEPFPFDPSSSTRLAVVGFDVQFDPPDPTNPSLPADEHKHPHNGRWFCDLDVDTGESYFPFLRLALVRFQPNANPRESASTDATDLRASRVVLTDFFQLAPARTASLAFDEDDPKRLNFSVSGPSYQDNLDVGNTGRPIPRVTVSVQVESRDASLWVPTGDTELLRDTSKGLGNAMWWGSITLPFPHGTRPMRLVIREFEQLPADDADRSNVGPSRFVERLVYADVLELVT